jgi:TatD DNase family protein
LIDTHSHIYSEEFDADRNEMILRAKENGITKIILPNIDTESLERMLALETQEPDFCFAAIGLHPTSVKADYENELEAVKQELKRRKYIAVGEIGIDLYWDKAFLKEQTTAFQTQIEWAIEYDLPIIIHVRDSFRETINAIGPYKGEKLRGVFHSFTGNAEDANEIFELGEFYIGINGIVTFKNSTLSQILPHIPLSRVLLETDAPYLAPVPFRGKRNESAYIAFVRDKLAEIYKTPIHEIDRITTQNSENLFF